MGPMARLATVRRAATAGLGSVMALIGCREADRSAPPTAPRPPVVLLSLDTTRVDHLGCYGYARPTSPHLDRLAAESVLYTHAVATSSWTLPSHASLFTGKLTTRSIPVRIYDASDVRSRTSAAGPAVKQVRRGPPSRSPAAGFVRR